MCQQRVLVTMIYICYLTIDFKKKNKTQLFIHRGDRLIYYFIEKQLLSFTAERIFKL